MDRIKKEIKKDMLRKIGSICKEHRQKNNIKQDLIAYRTGLSQTTISQFEKGDIDSGYLLFVYTNMFNININEEILWIQ